MGHLWATMSKLFRVRLALVFSLLLCAPAAFAAEVIHSFDSTVRVGQRWRVVAVEEAGKTSARA
jgi:hypothetical protein